MWVLDSGRDGLLLEARGFHRVLAVERVKGDNSQDSVSWEPNLG